MASHRSIRACLLVACLAAALVACTSTPSREPVASALSDQAITVASFNFPESRLLAELYGQALEAGGYAVDLEPALGPRELVVPALAKGLVELVPEYAGTAVQFMSVGAIDPSSEVEANYDALERALAGTNMQALAPAEAQNVNAFVVTRETADRLQIESLSDLRAVDSQLTFGGPPECPSRPLCLQGLQRTYGLRFGSFVPLDAGGPVSLQALKRDQVDVALWFSTDPTIASAGLVELVDDRDLQPAENVTPIVHRDVLRRWGTDAAKVIDAVSARLTNSQLRSLNARLGEDGEHAERVATVWLRAEGLA